jgi:hypothetical protein
MGLVFTLRMRIYSQVTDTGDRDTRKKVKVDHLFEGLELREMSFR